MSEENTNVDSNKTADVQNRVKGFNGELLPLLGKYKLALGAVPVILPDGRLGAKPQLVDDSEEKTDESASEKVVPA